MSEIVTLLRSTLGWLVIFTSVSAVAIGSDQIDFNSQVRPIFVKHCAECHGGVKQAGDLSLVYRDQVLPPDGWIVEPGDPEASLLIERVTSDDPDVRMPPPSDDHEPLPKEAVNVLRTWIAQGAVWNDPWALSPLSTSPPPTDATGLHAEVDRWANQPLDRWVAHGLVEHGLPPAPESDPHEWLRRVAFDLTGLPPTVEQTRDFVSAVNAAKHHGEKERVYAAQVDALLGSEHFGERWASVWMDLARYADSKGYEKDPHRDMWPYRDWLVRAFNQDMPFDQFTIKQLAGDLLDHPTADDLIATAFHRNTQTNTEGGTDDEEFRIAAVIDRVNTTWTVWQATTFGCVQCHSHPYDPYRHEEYYGSIALFNNSLDADLDSDFPVVKIPADPQHRDAAIDCQREYWNARRQRNLVGRTIAEQVQWEPIVPSSVSSTEGQLRISGSEVVQDSGTFPPGVVYTADAPAHPMTALRIDILPSSDDPHRWPEAGSVVSHLGLDLVGHDDAVVPIEIADVFVDAITSDEDPRAVLNRSNRFGVGGYPSLHRPRWAVFVLRQRLAPQPGATIRIRLQQSATVTGNRATPVRRFRMACSNDDRWNNAISDPDYRALDERVAELKQRVDGVRGANLPIMQPYANEVARMTRRFIRGNWMDRDEEVEPGIPALFQRSRHHDQPITNRLQLARWLVSKDNPLGARVAANRIWGQLFGRGIVETMEDFGSSGLPPSNPELLDHLAHRYRDIHQWRLKPFLREIVLSSTYRQSNHVTPQSQRIDPRNQWYSRGPRTRLTAEMIRDQALAVSGLLRDEIGGPSVMPYQPDGVWQTVYSNMQWKKSEPPQCYRRGLYTYWRRTSPYPSFLMFDAPTRDLCAARRLPTNTPLQALVTLNDPVYVECAEAFALRALNRSDGDVSDAIDWMYFAVTQRPASRRAHDELRSLYDDWNSMESGNASDLLDSDSSDRQPDRALSAVAQTILNLDLALTK